MMKPLLKEPLTHLLLMGGLLFFGYDLLNPGVNQDQENPPVIQKAEVDRFLAQKASADPQAFSDVDRKRWVKAFINDELLYQEAKRLGLDHDAFIRERLIQKARFYFEGQFVIPEVNEQTLKQFYQENSLSYREKKSVSFEHRLVNSEGIAQIEKMLSSRLPEDEFLSRMAPFQKRSLVSPTFNNAREKGLAKLFGGPFAKAIYTQPLNQWAGVLESDAGYHVVKLTGMEEGSVSTYEEVKAKVKEDWIARQREQWVDKQVKLLWQKYQINAKEFLPNA